MFEKELSYKRFLVDFYKSEISSNNIELNILLDEIQDLEIKQIELAGNKLDKFFNKCGLKKVDMRGIPDSNVVKTNNTLQKLKNLFK